jgi:site-specific recombinase XerD
LETTVTTPFMLDLDQALEGWTLHLEARNLSPTTIRAYRLAVRGLTYYLGSKGMPTDVEAISGEHVESFIADVVRSRAAATAHQRYRGLKQFFKWLTEQGDIRRDPMATVKPPLIPETHIDTVKIEDFRKMLKTCQTDYLDDVRDEALLRTLWDTGGRLAEVTGLQISDVDFSEKVIRLFGKGRRERNVAISASTAAALHRYLRRRQKTSQGTSPYLWTGRKGQLTPSGIRQMVWRRSDLAGLDHRAHPHAFRHSKADEWLKAGGSELGLRKQMGWRSPVMVARYAAKNAERRSIEEARRLGLGDRP